MGYRKVLTGVDGSATSLEALRLAARIANQDGAELIALYVAEEGRDASAVLEKARAVVREEGVEAVARSGSGDPAEGLLRLAEDENVDLLVVGNKGMTGVRRFLLGSVPNKISHHSPCDLLIARTT